MVDPAGREHPAKVQAQKGGPSHIRISSVRIVAGADDDGAAGGVGDGAEGDELEVAAAAAHRGQNGWCTGRRDGRSERDVTGGSGLAAAVCETLNGACSRREPPGD